MLATIIAGRGFGAWLDRYQGFLDPENPFISWLVIFDLAILLTHLFMVFWVYRDASWRYNRGAPWALFSFIFPLGGWLFYLLYRISPLTQFDRAEQELFDDDEHEWTDYDEYKANRSGSLFQELYEASMEGSGYTAEQRQSRRRELRRQLTPEEKVARREERLKEKQLRQEKLEQLRTKKKEDRRQAKQDARERSKMTGRHGFSFRMSDRRQRRIKQQLQMLESLKALPREDQIIEEMIFEMDYVGAQQAAQDALEIAREMNDAQGIITYEKYLERVNRLIDEELAEEREIDSHDQH
ncbi:MAG: hypothetical protein R3F46_10765 [bacterium]